MLNFIKANRLISRFSLDCNIKFRNGKKHNFHHGHEYVDLGLPSGTLWATCNVGAESETDYGNYYMCGNGSNPYNIHDKPYDGTENELPSGSDTATQVWGGMWHMPTREQMNELTRNTTYQWIHSDISGGLFTSNINGNSVFFPACGYYHEDVQNDVGRSSVYWSSSLVGSDMSYYLFLNRDNLVTFDISRNYGFTVRPVLNLKLSQNNG